MNPYNPATPCTKCGCDRVSTRHERAEFQFWSGLGPPPSLTAGPILSERLVRQCARCGYAWWEATLDAAKGAGT